MQREAASGLSNRGGILPSEEPRLLDEEEGKAVENICSPQPLLKSPPPSEED